MALEKVVEVDQIEVKGEYAIQVRQATKVLDDGKQIGGVSYHRHVVHPNSNWSGEDAKVKKIADALFDADCIEAYFVSQNGHPSGEPASGWNEEKNSKQLLTYATLVVPLIKAVQELTAKVEALEAK